MSKKCPKCGNKEIIIDKHEFAYCTDCEMYDLMELFPEQSVFDQITASPEVLAPQFLYHVTSFLDGLDKPKKIWYSTLIQGRAFASETEAKRATVARLKEVCND